MLGHILNLCTNLISIREHHNHVQTCPDFWLEYTHFEWLYSAYQPQGQSLSMHVIVCVTFCWPTLLQGLCDSEAWVLLSSVLLSHPLHWSRGHDHHCHGHHTGQCCHDFFINPSMCTRIMHGITVGSNDNM